MSGLRTAAACLLATSLLRLVDRNGDGWVSVDRGGIHASDDKLLRITLGPNDKRFYESESQQGNFVDCIKSRRPTINPIDSAVNSDLISHLSDTAIRLGRSIKWDHKKERIVGDDDATRTLNRTLRPPWRI